ncbi:MAG: glycosyltransferase [Candidatus Saccharibacteria bacterium]|nr:glycosyltransferase [Candidatus Saccharibacteria bacterium]
MATLKVSVVIPAYNEATYIDRLLDGLANQDFDAFEVIVSDAESKDGTDDVVRQFSKKLNVTLLTSPPKGPAHGRNVGAAAAKGEWLLFLDADDDISDPLFMQKLVSEAEANGWNTASATVKTIDGNLVERFGNWVNYRYVRLLARSKHPVAAGWCILTRRDVFESNGGFNEKIHFGEDYDYVSRVAKGKFGFVTSTCYYIDLRRSREEGWRFAVKGVANEIYRHSHGYNLENNPNTYEFGKHKPRG